MRYLRFIDKHTFRAHIATELLIHATKSYIFDGFYESMIDN